LLGGAEGAGVIIRPLAAELPRFAELSVRFRQELRSRIGGDAAIWEDGRAFDESLDAALAAVVRRAVEPGFQDLQRALWGGSEIEAFAPRWISTGSAAGAAHAVAELRFKGLDVSQPFVELSLFDCRVPEQMAELVDAALIAFEAFSPGRVRASLSQRDAAVFAIGGLDIEADVHSVAGSFRSLRARSDLAPPRIELRAVTDIRASYEYYSMLYRSFESSQPDLARELYRSTFDEFANMAASKKTFEAHVDGLRAGLVAATPAKLWGQPGWVMHEECLAAEFRGRGLGLDLQRALFNRLDTERGVLWGTIHARNLPSLRTAQRHGRSIVQSHYFLAPRGSARQGGAGPHGHGAGP
jgi:hypothetical protein